MGRRRIIELVVLGLWLAIAVVLYIHNKNQQNNPTPVPDKLLPQIPESEVGKQYEVKKVTVVRGDSFDLTIKDGNDSRILARLSVAAVENAKGKVLDVLNHCTKPRVVLREKQPDGRWTIDFFFTSEGKEINLADWLAANKLVYK